MKTKSHVSPSWTVTTLALKLPFVGGLEDERETLYSVIPFNCWRLIFETAVWKDNVSQSAVWKDNFSQTAVWNDNVSQTAVWNDNVSQLKSSKHFKLIIKTAL